MATKKEKEFKTFKFKVSDESEDDNTGHISGFASTFGNVDQGGDIIEPGAFAKTIREQKAFPKLLDHDPRKPAGFSKLKETSRGLFFESELKLFDPEVRQRFELTKLSLKLDAPMGVSIGFIPVKISFDEVDGQRVRRLEEIRLLETSLVTFPMNTAATATGAKSLEIYELFELIQKGNYSLSKIKEALSILEEQNSKNGAANFADDPKLSQSLEALRDVFK